MNSRARSPRRMASSSATPTTSPFTHSRRGSVPSSQRRASFEREGDRRTIYSRRHTCASCRDGANCSVLARNRGASVKLMEQYCGHTSNRAMAEELTKRRARRRVKMHGRRQRPCQPKWTNADQLESCKQLVHAIGNAEVKSQNLVKC